MIKLVDMFISEEERIALCIREAQSQGHEFPLENWASVVEHFYTLKNWADDRYDLRDLGDGSGVHLFRPYILTPEEGVFIAERRERRERELRKKRSNATRLRNRANK